MEQAGHALLDSDTFQRMRIHLQRFGNHRRLSCVDICLAPRYLGG